MPGIKLPLLDAPKKVPLLDAHGRLPPPLEWTLARLRRLRSWDSFA